MSDSHSELSSPPAIPSDASLEKGLRDAVANLFKSRNRDDLTLKRLRLATENALALPEGFFKGDAKWKAESERIIRDEADEQEAAQERAEKEKVAPAKPKPKPKSKPEKKTARPPKRASPEEPAKPAKRQKKTPPDDSEDELSAPPSDLSDEKPKKAVKPSAKPAKAKPKATSKSKKEPKVVDSDEEEKPSAKRGKGQGKAKSKPKEESKVLHSGDEGTPAPKEPDEAHASGGEVSTPKSVKKANGAAKIDDSESELSEVPDPTPKPKKRGRKSSESSKPEKSKKPSKAKDDSHLTPDEAEIKKLQSWLIKCGIRKMWFRELAPYDTPKEKIRHLKGMLKDAGMDGRYSNEKAAQIKEERELKADLDMVQEGAKRWGADAGSDEEVEEEEEEKEEEEADGRGKPKRKLARGLKEVVDFLGSDDGEETS